MPQKHLPLHAKIIVIDLIVRHAVARFVEVDALHLILIPYGFGVFTRCCVSIWLGLPLPTGEVLKLLEIWLGCRPAGRAIDHHAGCRRRQQGAPHGEENTRIDAHPPIAVRADRGTSGLAGRPGGTGQAGDAADRRGGAGGGVPGCARPRLLRARRRGRPGLSQRRADRPAEDGGGADRLRRTAGRRARGAVPLGDPQPPEGPDRGARGAGGRAAGPRPLGARHRGRLPRRERPAAACRAPRSPSSASSSGPTTRTSPPAT